MRIFSILCVAWVLLSLPLQGQNTGIEVKDLALPSSPAFVIVDASPTVVQNPTTPKAFVLGVTQSFQQNNLSFPQEYSAEFAPYWWIKPGTKSIRDLTGIPVGMKKSERIKENYFAGIKFTTLSTGFFQKDMVVDSSASPQKIVSFGFRSSLFRIHQKSYGYEMNRLVERWHRIAQDEMDNNLELLTAIARDPERIDELKSAFTPQDTRSVTDSINKLLQAKPLFAIDVAGAYAMYGIEDTVWKTGRFGVWTTLSSYLPLTNQTTASTARYLSINLFVRYIGDQYSQDDISGRRDIRFLDLGGKLAYDTDVFSLGVEAIYRVQNNSAETYNRITGLMSYKLAENLSVYAALGKNFTLPGKLISLFGLQWGFGSETLRL